MSGAPLEWITRPYEPGDETEIIALFNEVFSENNESFEPRTLEQWQWQFEKNPAGQRILLGVDTQGKIVGQFCSRPAWANVRGERMLCSEAVDSLVAKPYRKGLRKRGLFVSLAEEFIETHGREDLDVFMYGCPNELAFPVGTRLLHYRPVFAPLPILERPPRSDGKRPDAVQEVERFGPELDRLWERLIPVHEFALCRDASYWNWRYADCPLADYRLLAMPDASGELRGAAVIREGWLDEDVLAIVDWLVPREDAGASQALLDAAESIAQENGLSPVQTWLHPEQPEFAWFKEQGFETRDTFFNLCIRIYHPDLTLSWVKPTWYFTMGDSDIY
ncbi:MAG: GNAT family N-acetyltransferase [Planctomycetota bacterium]